MISFLNKKEYISTIIGQIISPLILIIFLLIAVAFFTLSERKGMAAIQRRLGPNVVGFWGLLQPLADGLKLIIKEIVVPRKANNKLFFFSPFLTFVTSLLGWSVIPFGVGNTLAEIEYSLLFIFTTSSLSIYGILISGWASNSRYSFLGSLRSAAQMISYEINIGFILIGVILCTGSLNLGQIATSQMYHTIWYIIPMYPLAMIFLISMLAETNRAPFDLPEAEAELVSGYNTEYSSVTFALFFLGEYSNMLIMSSIMTILFFGGWDLGFINNFFKDEVCFATKTIITSYLFILIRAILPRYRYDILMEIGWKIFLPLTLGYLLFTSGILIALDGLPSNGLYLLVKNL